MNSHSTAHGSIASSYDRAMAIALTTLGMFILGYSATRVILNYTAASVSTSTESEVVVPHQASMWSALGESYSD